MQTSRLQLTRLTESHLEGYHKIWQDPIATKWSPHGPCNTLQESREWMANLLVENNPQGENYAVLARGDIDVDVDFLRDELVVVVVGGGASSAGADAAGGTSTKAEVEDKTSSPSVQLQLQPGKFLGWIGTWRTEPIPEVGFIFDREVWGHGIASEAMRAFLELFWQKQSCFDILDAWCDVENGASERVLRKGGFGLVEVCEGDYRLEWMVPALRSSLHFRMKRPGSGSGSGSGQGSGSGSGSGGTTEQDKDKE